MGVIHLKILMLLALIYLYEGRLSNKGSGSGEACEGDNSTVRNEQIWIERIESEVAWSGLTPREQMFGYYLYRSFWEIDKANYFRNTYEAPGLFVMLQVVLKQDLGVFRSKLVDLGVSQAEFDQFMLYAVEIFRNKGNFDLENHVKIIPQIKPDQFWQIIRASSGYQTHKTQLDHIITHIQTEIYNPKPSRAIHSSNLKPKDIKFVHKFLKATQIWNKQIRITKGEHGDFTIMMSSADKTHTHIMPKYCDIIHKWKGTYLKVVNRDLSQIFDKVHTYLTQAQVYARDQAEKDRIEKYLKYLLIGDGESYHQAVEKVAQWPYQWYLGGYRSGKGTMDGMNGMLIIGDGRLSKVKRLIRQMVDKEFGVDEMVKDEMYYTSLTNIQHGETYLHLSDNSTINLINHAVPEQPNYVKDIETYKSMYREGIIVYGILKKYTNELLYLFLTSRDEILKLFVSKEEVQSLRVWLWTYAIEIGLTALKDYSPKQRSWTDKQSQQRYMLMKRLKENGIFRVSEGKIVLEMAKLETAPEVVVMFNISGEKQDSRVEGDMIKLREIAIRSQIKAYGVSNGLEMNHDGQIKSISHNLTLEGLINSYTSRYQDPFQLDVYSHWSQHITDFKPKK